MAGTADGGAAAPAAGGRGGSPGRLGPGLALRATSAPPSPHGWKRPGRASSDT